MIEGGIESKIILRGHSFGLKLKGIVLIISFFDRLKWSSIFVPLLNTVFHSMVVILLAEVKDLLNSDIKLRCSSKKSPYSNFKVNHSNFIQY